MGTPTSADLLAELTANPAGLEAVFGVPDGGQVVDRALSLADAFALGEASAAAVLLNAPLRRQNISVLWADIFRYLDTLVSSGFGGVPVRYALSNYTTLAGANAVPALAVACWMAVENWQRPAYPTVDVHNVQFTTFAGALAAAGILAPEAVTHIVDELGTAPISRAQELWGLGTVITAAQIAALVPRPAAPVVPALLVFNAPPIDDADAASRAGAVAANLEARRVAALALEAYTAEYGAV